MHREIMGLKRNDKILTDHINCDGLDNRKENLRKCNSKENGYNQKLQRRCSSKYKGVHKNSNKWVARIKKDKKSIYLGIYNNEIDAANAYNESAKKLFGEYAQLNMLE